MIKEKENPSEEYLFLNNPLDKRQGEADKDCKFWKLKLQRELTWCKGQVSGAQNLDHPKKYLNKQNSISTQTLEFRLQQNFMWTHIKLFFLSFLSAKDKQKKNNYNSCLKPITRLKKKIPKF